jgi:hypothetical protein
MLGSGGGRKCRVNVKTIAGKIVVLLVTLICAFVEKPHPINQRQLGKYANNDYRGGETIISHIAFSKRPHKLAIKGTVVLKLAVLI